MLHLERVCPRSVMILGKLGVERWQWRWLAGRYPDEFKDFDHGGDTKAVLQAIGAKSPLSKEQKSLVRCAASRRLWPDSRRAAEGYQAEGRCSGCLDESGTLRHALFRCPSMALHLHHRDLGEIATGGAECFEEHALFSRGLVPDIRHQAPQALRTEDVVWDDCSRTGSLE
ncbi:MAG: hypothetical protein GY824_20535, partial [Delftia sp.]|nr:hypothetical protein [Delftia sp.]